MDAEVTEVNQLRTTADKARFELAESRTALANTDYEIASIAADVRDGRTDRTSEIPKLQNAKSSLQQTIKSQEEELGALRAELQRMKNAADRATLEEIFTEMRATRQEILTLGRQMALLLGKLHGDLLERGEKLVPRVVGDLRQQEFVRLLEPVDLYGDREWYGGLAEMNGVEHIHVVKVRPMQTL